MTTPSDLHAALTAYAHDHGLAAAYALILESATDSDLARLSVPLGEMRNSKGNRVGLGDQQRAEILRAVSALLNKHTATLYEHTEPWPGEIHVYGGTDASSAK